jgi:hypothetical protein
MKMKKMIDFKRPLRRDEGESLFFFSSDQQRLKGEEKTLAEGNWEKYGRHTIPITSRKIIISPAPSISSLVIVPIALERCKMSSNKFRFSVSIESNPKEIYNSKERRECQRRIKGRIKNAQFNSSFERKRKERTLKLLKK